VEPMTRQGMQSSWDMSGAKKVDVALILARVRRNFQVKRSPFEALDRNFDSDRR